MPGGAAFLGNLGRVDQVELDQELYLAKNPGGYCGLGSTGVACPSGILGAARR
jgi:hypothetical protein